MGHGTYSPQDDRGGGLDEWHPGDVTIETLRQATVIPPDVIIHCAGGSSVGLSLSEPLQDFQRTVGTTLQVLEYIRVFAPGASLIYPSSAGVYGLADHMPIAETDSLNPVSPYGVHKKMAEELCRSYGAHYGIRSAIVRLFSVYGIGLRKQLLWDTCQKLRRGELTFWGTGEETRDWLYVKDAADLLWVAGRHTSRACPVVNGGTGSGIPIREIVKEIFSCFERDDTPVFLGQSRPGDPVHYEADIRLAMAWGWKPSMSLREGIREYVTWFRRNIR